MHAGSQLPSRFVCVYHSSGTLRLSQPDVFLSSQSRNCQIFSVRSAECCWADRRASAARFPYHSRTWFTLSCAVTGVSLTTLSSIALAPLDPAYQRGVSLRKWIFQGAIKFMRLLDAITDIGAAGLLLQSMQWYLQLALAEHRQQATITLSSDDVTAADLLAGTARVMYDQVLSRTW